MRSARGSRPNTESFSSMSVVLSEPSVRTLVFISSLRRLFGCGRCGSLCGLLYRCGHRSFLRERVLDGIAHHHPAALGARHRAADHDEAAFDIDLGDFEVLRRHAIHAVMAVHLLVLEGLARILTAARTTERTVRDRHAVRGFETTEIPALHRAREPTADGDARDVDLLARHEMVGLKHVTHIEQVRCIDAEFHELL